MSFEPSVTLRSNLIKVCEDRLPAEALSLAQREAFVSQLEQLLLQAKLESLAEFAAGAGHEINNPVATIVGRAQLLMAGETDPERRHALEVIGGQALRIRDMIGDTMLFGRPPTPRIEQLILLELVQQAVKSQSSLQSTKQANISIDVDSQLAIHADRTQLLVVLSNLIRNSLEAADQEGVNIRLESRTAVRDSVQYVLIIVRDDGPGLTETEREHLFDPFFSGRPAGRGLGFGLSKCWRIVTLHGGQILAKEAGGSGTVLEVWWPQSPE